MDNKTAEYKERVNKGVLTVTEAKLFIEEFNTEVNKYGRYKVPEALTWVEMDYSKNVKYIDYKYGWAKRISLEKDFVVKVKGNDIFCKINLPEPVQFLD